jgi:hypothetical protein
MKVLVMATRTLGPSNVSPTTVVTSLDSYLRSLQRTSLYTLCFDGPVNDQRRSCPLSVSYIEVLIPILTDYV